MEISLFASTCFHGSKFWFSHMYLLKYLDHICGDTQTLSCFGYFCS
uniref:Uncharacterized protein n=1 Tax=Rhizophora mucronata TaxID=61149 RepID=A0A2P2KJJ2_RHIMU